MLTFARKRPGKRSAMRQAGFTLLEFAVSLGFMSALGGLIAGSSFLALKTGTETNGTATVAVETAKTTRWLVRDIGRAGRGGAPTDPSITPTSLNNPDTATSALFRWYESGSLVECTYSLSGTDLQRNCGSGSLVVGRSLSGLQFTRAGDLITITYVITPATAPAKAETIVLNVALGGG